MATSKNKAPAKTVARTPEAVLAEYPEMVMSIPVGAEGDGSAIIARALGAASWQALNDEAESLPNAEAMIGTDFMVETLERRESDLDSGVGWYLVVGGTRMDTGEWMTWQTSSATVMAKLVKLSNLSVLPARVEVYRVDKRTKAGFYPLDITIHSATEPGSRGY